MFDVNIPLYAKIYDFSVETEEAEKNFIVRKVDSIEFTCKHHDNAIIWYSGGFKSESFEILPQGRERENNA